MVIEKDTKKEPPKEKEMVEAQHSQTANTRISSRASIHANYFNNQDLVVAKDLKPDLR